MPQILALIAILTVICLAMGFPTMWIMNYILSAEFLTFVFGASKMGFWKAFFINLLCGILIKGSSSSSD